MSSDIFRTANLLIKEYGEMASVGAQIKVDQMFKRGDMQGQQLWLKVAKAVEQLQSEKAPLTNQTLH